MGTRRTLILLVALVGLAGLAAAADEEKKETKAEEAKEELALGEKHDAPDVPLKGGLHEKEQAKPMFVVPEKPHGGKIGLKKPLKKKKKGGGWMGLMMIPLLIQAKLIPLVIAKLKILATKALIVGKLALLILAINFLYGMKQKSGGHVQQDASLAKEHYGYTGGPEYGAWINRRGIKLNQRVSKDLPYRAHQPNGQ